MRPSPCLLCIVMEAIFNEDKGLNRRGGFSCSYQNGGDVGSVKYFYSLQVTTKLQWVIGCLA